MISLTPTLSQRERDRGTADCLRQKRLLGGLQHVEGILGRIQYRCRLIPAVHHAVSTAWVATGAVALPIRGLQQFLEGVGIAIAHQITGALPAEDVPRRVPPRRALIGSLPFEEIQVEGRVVELPAP